MGKTRDLFKKTRHIKKTFHAKMGTIKDSMDLIDTEDTKKRWQEYTHLYKKELNGPDNHDAMIIHLEPDILECEVKWALGSITVNKVSGGEGIPAELFQILKDDAVKVLHSVCQYLENSSVATGLEKIYFHSNLKEKQCQRMFKLLHKISLISHTSKVMLKILQARLQQYVNRELPNTQVGFRKDRGTRDQIFNIRWIIKKAREFQKNIYFCFIDYAKTFDSVDHNKLWKILKEMVVPDQLPVS